MNIWRNLNSTKKRGLIFLGVFIICFLVWASRLPVLPNWKIKEMDAVQDIHGLAREYLVSNAKPSEFMKSPRMGKYMQEGKVRLSDRPDSFVSNITLTQGYLNIDIVGLDTTSCVNLTRNTILSFKNGARGVVKFGKSDQWIGLKTMGSIAGNDLENNDDALTKAFDECMGNPSPLTIRLSIEKMDNRVGLGGNGISTSKV